MEELIIKTEHQEYDDFKPQILIGDITSNAAAEPSRENLKSRCGEIFVTNNARKWTFTCTYCDKTTRDVGEFICHIQFKHMSGQYTDEEDDNADNAEEIQPMEAAYNENSFNNQEQNIFVETLNKTKHPAQAHPLTTPTMELVSTFSNSYNTSTFEVTNFGCSAPTNSDEELNLIAGTSQQHSEFTQPTTTPVLNRGKRRRLDQPNTCQNSQNCLQQYDRKFEQLTESVNQLKGNIEKLAATSVQQNAGIMEALATQNILTEKLIGKEKDEAKIRNIFPIQTVDDLVEANKNINEDNRALYTRYMSSLLKGELHKCLTEIFSVDLIIACNIDGIHGKLSLKNFKLLFDSLIDAIGVNGADNPEKSFRNALKIVKKRHFQAICVSKKKETMKEN